MRALWSLRIAPGSAVVATGTDLRNSPPGSNTRRGCRHGNSFPGSISQLRGHKARCRSTGDCCRKAHNWRCRYSTRSLDQSRSTSRRRPRCSRTRLARICWFRRSRCRPRRRRYCLAGRRSRRTRSCWGRSECSRTGCCSRYWAARTIRLRSRTPPGRTVPRPGTRCRRTRSCWGRSGCPRTGHCMEFATHHNRYFPGCKKWAVGKYRPFSHRRDS